ncbi:hypothetical protein PF004_g24042 [Phytophthora fragariae]|uniref:Uncharacterized protein n=1 Tax=Phytophthora fragariae TaxID=53985 RepID=A0A6G0MX74_9STRA|nr:hypothetical protein PF004_g24042 [Phytophthora fragariae]
MKVQHAQARSLLKEQQDREIDQTKEQRALKMKRRKIERSVKSLCLKEECDREKEYRRRLKHDAKENKSPTEPIIVASALV